MQGVEEGEFLRSSLRIEEILGKLRSASIEEKKSFTFSVKQDYFSEKGGTILNDVFYKGLNISIKEKKCAVSLPVSIQNFRTPSNPDLEKTHSVYDDGCFTVTIVKEQENDLIMYLNATDARLVKMIEAMKTSSHEAIKNGTKIVGGVGPFSCNVCVRSYFYHLKNDPVLFPKNGSGLDDFSSSTPIYGEVTDPGRVNQIVDDLEQNKLSGYFVPFTEKVGGILDYSNMQKDVNKGEIFIGIWGNPGGHGHIVVAIPQQLKPEITNKMREINVNQRIRYYLPIVIECGKDSKEIMVFKNKNSFLMYKWYKYVR